MDKNWFAIIALLAIILIGAAFLLFRPAKLSPPELETCNSLVYNGENKINLVFFANQETTKQYSSFLLQALPLSQNKNSFNIYYIDSFQPKCELYKGIAILCYSSTLIKKAASCPNDYIVVIKDQDSGIRSSSYMNVLSINSNHPESVLLHEFGHAFTNLADEYVPANIPKKSQNCVLDCSEFAIREGCFPGCSKESYYRSIDEGVMRTLSSSNYGKFNEQLIKNKLSSTTAITSSVIQSTRNCATEKYILIKGNYSNGNVEILDKNIETGCPGSSGAGPFKYSLISTTDTQITSGDFNPELIFTDNQGKTQIEGATFVNEGSFLLKLQVIENAKSLQILNAENEKLAEINLQDTDARPCQI